MLPFKKIKINKKKPHDSEKMNHTTDWLEGLHFVRHDTIGQSTQLYQSDMEEWRWLRAKATQKVNSNKSCVDCQVAMVVSIRHFNSKFAKNKLQSV